MIHMIYMIYMIYIYDIFICIWVNFCQKTHLPFRWDGLHGSYTYLWRWFLTGVIILPMWYPQIIHLFIGISIIFTIHFGGFPPIFGNTHMGNPYKLTLRFALEMIPPEQVQYFNHPCRNPQSSTDVHLQSRFRGQKSIQMSWELHILRDPIGMPKMPGSINF